MRMKYAKNDFTKDDLPLNRRKQFGYIFRSEWTTILKIGLIFLLPLITLLLLEGIEWTLIASALHEMQEAGETAGYNQTIYFIEAIFNATLIIPFICFALVLSGTSRVYQKLIYGEGLLFKGDFSYGVITNFKQYAVIAIIYWIINFTVSFLGLTLKLDGGDLARIMNGAIDAILSFVIAPAFLIALSFLSTYKMKLGEALGNGFKVLISYLLMPVLVGLIIFAFSFVNFDYLHDILILIPILQTLFVFLFLPTLQLVWKLNMTRIFDKNINENTYPQIYLKGLRDYNYEGDKKDENSQH